MDPIAHTLIGATIAETPLGKKTPLASVTAMLAANAPDIDFGCSVLGRDVSLGFRRGHTHGVLGMAILPLVLTGLVVWYDRRFRRPKGLDPVNPRSILLLSYIGVLSHPALDWLNNYGVRLLMPFSGEWFYGDSIFIIDPWMWLLAASAVMLAHSKTRRAINGWLVLAGLTSTLVLGTSYPPMTTKVVWCFGVGALLLLRLRPPAERLVPHFATGALVVLATYIGANVTGTAVARSQARAWFESRGIEPELVVVGPLPGRPLARDVIVRAGGTYHFAQLDWQKTPSIEKSHDPTPMNDGPDARRALAKRPGLETWIRLPAFEKKIVDGRTVIEVRDVRYDRMGANLGRARIPVSEP